MLSNGVLLFLPVGHRKLYFVESDLMILHYDDTKNRTTKKLKTVCVCGSVIFFLQCLILQKGCKELHINDIHFNTNMNNIIEITFRWIFV